MLGQSIKAVDALVAALRHTEDDLVFQQVHAGGGVHEVQTVGVHVGRSGDVQLVHLLLTGGEEEVAVGALLDLGLESTGGIEVEAEGDARVLGRVVLGDGVQGLGQGGSGEDDELDALAGSLGRSGLRGSSCGRGSAGSSAAAGGQGSGSADCADHGQKAAAGNEIGFHEFSPSIIGLYFRPTAGRCCFRNIVLFSSGVGFADTPEPLPLGEVAAKQTERA